MHESPYLLLDSGDQQRLEKFGPYTLIRPCSQAVWSPQKKYLWKEADALFTREEGNCWHFYKKMPQHWTIRLEDLLLKVSPTDFGHLGVFPEHQQQWAWMHSLLKKKNKVQRVLHLFAYSGATTLKLAQCQAEICHVDASKKSVAWAADNRSLNGLEEAPIRWIVEDVTKFLQREVRRGVVYDAIVLDPPSFGKGSKGEVFKIEKDLPIILKLCQQLLSSDPLFMLLTCHTPGFTPSVLEYLLKEILVNHVGTIESAEMFVHGQETLSLPSGSFARWSSYG